MYPPGGIEIEVSCGKAVSEEVKCEGQCRFDEVCTGESVYVDEARIQAVHYVDAIVKNTRWQPEG
jgi:hypothetical protein